MINNYTFSFQNILTVSSFAKHLPITMKKSCKIFLLRNIYRKQEKKKKNVGQRSSENLEKIPSRATFGDFFSYILFTFSITAGITFFLES